MLIQRDELIEYCRDLYTIQKLLKKAFEQCKDYVKRPNISKEIAHIPQGRGKSRDEHSELLTERAEVICFG